MIENEFLCKKLIERYSRVDILEEEQDVIKFTTSLVDTKIKTAMLEKKMKMINVYERGSLIETIELEN